MSLKVWLPLNGDLENRGISNFPVTNNGATVNTSGKIGSCYSFNGSSNYLASTYNFYNSVYSVSAWIYTTSTSATQTIVCDRTTVGYGFSIFLIGGKIRIDPGGNNVQWTTSYTYPANTWFHLVVTYDGAKVAYYINGILQQTYTAALTASYWGTTTSIGASQANGSGYGNYLNGKLNDVRIYDHCLSAAEVKEISQGLVLHYKLDSKYIEGTTNLYSGTFSNTCYNGATNKYGYGTNTDIYKTTGFFQGKNSVKIYMGTAGLDAYPYIYFDAFNSTGTNIHTLSFDYYPTIQTSIIPYSYNGTYNMSYITSNGDSDALTNVSQITIPVITNQWNHISITMQKYDTTNTSRGNGYIRLGSAKHTSTTTDYWLFANIQVEAKAYETGYTDPGTTRNNTIIQDSSGYNNNGIINGTLSIYSNTTRYSFTCSFNGVDSSIKVPYNTVCPHNNFTCNLWFKKDAWGTKGYETLFGGPSGFEMDTRSGTNQALQLNMVSTRSGKRNLVTEMSLGNWYMITMTRSDTIEKYYVNGIFQSEIEAKAMPTGNYFIGAWSSATSQNYYGYISDFRLYDTVLSDEDILKLYNTSMSIDNLSNAHQFEINESNTNKLTKSGILFDQIVEPYLTLSDGSKWKLMLCHYVDNGRRLFTSSNATYCNELGLYSRLNEITNYSYDNKYEYYVIQDGKEFRWTQTSSPIATSISGLTTVSGYLNPVNGLAKPTSLTQTYIGYNSWWGACGCWTSYSTGGKTGIPGFGSHNADGICEDYLALYTRISDIYFKLKDELVEAAEFIER